MQKRFQHTTSIITYDIEGEGMPVVLLHGFGEDRTIWNEQIAFLKSYCKLIVPDLPGSGKSVFLEKVSQDSFNQPSTIEYYAGCIYALLQYENIRECIMLGHSMGGYITLAFAEEYPELLKSFGLIHSTAFADNEEKKQNRQRSIKVIEEYGAYAFLKNTIPNLFAQKFKTEHQEKVNALIEQGNNFSKQALQNYYTAMMQRPDRTNVLRNSKKPVLFVIGTEDTAAPMQDVLQQVPLPEIVYIHILENTGHMGMWEATKKMNNALLEFIQESLRNE